MGGIKESGIGVRHGAEGIRKYCTRAHDPADAAPDAPRREPQMYPYTQALGAAGAQRCCALLYRR